MRYQLYLLFVLALACLADGVPSAYEADSFFRSAELYYESGDYENALRSVYLANQIYEELESDWGMERTSLLQSQIENTLSKQQLAGIYYDLAGDYYLEGSYENMQLCVALAERARAVYQQIEGPQGVNGVIKAEDLITRARSQMDVLRNDCIKGGNEYYYSAQNAFFNEEYNSARSLAVNASQIYLSCPYQKGVEDAASLLTSITNKIKDISINAMAAYDTAVDYHTQGNTQMCLDFAREAQRLYRQIDETQGYASATSLISNCEKEINVEKEKKLREASNYLDQAKALSIIPDCENATLYADKALDIYTPYYEEARSRELDLPENLRVDTKLYQAYIWEVNSLKKVIQDTCGRERILEIADDYYRRSQLLYLENRLTDSKAYAEKASSMCTQYQDYVCVEKVNTLLEEIELRQRQRDQADEFLKNAMGFYRAANFEEALLEATKSKNIYSSIKDDRNLEKAENTILIIRESLDKLSQANNHYQNGVEYMQLGNYNGALEQMQKANILYRELNYTLGSIESNTRIGEIQEQIGIQNKNLMNTVIVVGAVLILGGFLLIQFMRKKQSIEKKYEEKLEKEDRNKKIREQEWNLRMEEETKSKVEDELRKLVKEERGNIEE